MKSFCVIKLKHILPFCFMLSCVLFTNSCRKDDDDPAEITQYRIKDYTLKSDQGFLIKTTVQYTGEKVTMISSFSGFQPAYLHEFQRWVVEYPVLGSGYIQDFYTNDIGGWESSTMYEFEYSGDNTQSSIKKFHSGSDWLVYSKLTRQYDGDILKSSLRYKTVDGILEEDTKETYFYTGNVLDSIIKMSKTGNDWIPATKSIITYISGNLSEKTDYVKAETWIANEKTVYQYAASRLTGYEEYLNADGTWVEKPHSFSFQYDSNGNLSGWDETLGIDHGTVTFTFEPGKGNWKQIMDILADNWFTYNIVFKGVLK